jgi:hypothetical protein
MRPTNQIQPILLQKLFEHLIPKRIANPPLRYFPPRLALIRIRPQNITEQARFRDLGGSLDGGDLVH